MSGGDIAGLIAAGVFAILVAFLALPLIKVAGFSAAVRAGILSFRGPKKPSARSRRSK